MKILVLHGGGLGSAAALAEAVNRFERTQVAAFTMTQRPESRAEEHARFLTAHYRVHHVRVPMPIKLRSAPYRLGIWLGAATAYACEHGYAQVWLGSYAARAATTPDQRPEWLDGFAYATTQGTAGAVALKAPWEAYDLGQVAAIALRLEVPVDLTWSCEGNTRAFYHCGWCMGCVRRKCALRQEHPADPTHYEVQP